MTRKNSVADLLLGVLIGLVLGGAAFLFVLHRPGAAPQHPAAAASARAAPQPHHLADFGAATPSADAHLVANWALYTGDNQGKAVVLIDKKQAHAYVFEPHGQLRGDAPVLLGSWHGDDTVPGVGDKPLAAVLPEEKTTPAGRFVAEPGVNANGEDVVWVDYDAAVSMHRVRTTVKAERRLERLASPTPDDNRISFGCINVPKAFYEQVLSPTVRSMGAVVYVLPEVRGAEEVFGARAVPTAAQVAAR